ncbi:high mobility group B protein 15 [Arachis duranensis]|uniref:High mobility group B protein 15 n=1 Tax=Arachis duranensis TaxID=130453 RepID=A0A6P4C7K5_ARADU|nr:high mobility group B protein 15 [Arachis duranensis]XP_015942261.1 high mobility group B protein 15 [Arachis duranensis]XP_052109798.1 high mobility group B protein 15 [Arachis duranensis]XP_052109799.1 high mobility group B protein 15 [Arachis duranensis]
MASASCASKSPLPMKDAGVASASGYYVYPPPQASYEEVANNPKLFMETLEKLHSSMGTKFMIPIIGGRELDLHRLFVEVTSRGGIEKIIKERKWKEVTATFNFPSTATNASFVLRKYYASLLYHYEQIYYFKAPGWSPAASSFFSSAGGLQCQSSIPVPVQKAQFMLPSSGFQSPVFQQSSANAAELPEAMRKSSGGSQVIGVIDGKFESGYLVTVTIGSEKLKGVLYQAPQKPGLSTSHHGVLANNSGASAPLGVRRRRRRKKSEIKRRDPAHPKPNRSGYNFFFAEQHARLKAHHHGKDREISRIIGELWNKLNESERVVYQEKAMKDKERYRVEMEDYREKQKMGQVISDAVPLQQRLPEDMKLDETEGDSFQTPEESSTGGSDYDDDRAMEKDFDEDASPVAGMGAESSCLGSEKSPNGGL